MGIDSAVQRFIAHSADYLFGSSVTDVLGFHATPQKESSGRGNPPDLKESVSWKCTQTLPIRG
jgi:hypothetical protein